MATREEKAKTLLENIVAQLDLKVKISGVMYRDDYMDYFVVVNDEYYCEIREKVIDTYLVKPDADLLKDIRFRLANLTFFEELAHEHNARQEGGGGDDKGDIVIEDAQKYDL